MRILKDHAIFIIIDVQEKLFPVMSQAEKLRDNMVKLIKGMEILKLPFLITQQYTKGLGPTIKPIAEQLKDYLPLEKVSFSCCDEPDFEDKLEEFAKPVAIVSGIEAHVCVLQTVVDMIKMGFTVVVVEDCIDSRKENDKRIAIERMKQEGAFVASYESILFELCRVSDTGEFKAISKLLK